jgi:hypothetical protein
MSSDWNHLEMEFKKFQLNEKSLEASDQPIVTKSCSCPDISKPFSFLEVAAGTKANSKLKVKDRKGSNQLIKPARLKIIGNCYAKKLKGMTEKADESKTVADFTSEAFLKLRISPVSSSVTYCEPSKLTTNAYSHPPPDERLPSSSSSSSLNCSTQAKLQNSLSTEFDSTIDEMSDFLAYHLSLFNHRDNLIDSMYT